jgi:lysophospholipase L1-like esterase
LFKLIAGAGQKTTFTGSQKSGPTDLQVAGQTFSQRHEGHNGWGISEVNPNSGGSKGLTTLIPSPAFDAANGGLPNIILLHIGTNDSGTYSAAQMQTDLKGLLDQITTAAPEALVVLAQIVPLGYGDNAVIKAYNQAIPGIVDAQVAAKKHVTKVDMFTGFTPGTMIGSDKVHPNDSGYTFMAERWYAAIGPLLPK